MDTMTLVGVMLVALALGTIIGASIAYFIAYSEGYNDGVNVRNKQAVANTHYVDRAKRDAMGYAQSLHQWGNR